ncbi:hypothetical protein ACFO1B_40910 [Dactylosporangium siamense]|uniref:Uncharacterized protein n=1 Tax=Dactylosporangium siamense TaxID=685454 RepID=A0A919PIL4_9ACTN|nr:hypothetical protein [Dactylosporangium siamense]GIG42618.1 hypothetical protein Dsi01nite_006590 [Dactylosporangium siamense]
MRPAAAAVRGRAPADTWPVGWPLIRAMAATHLDGGRDVVLPRYFAVVEEIAGFEWLARESDDPWIRHHHHRLVELGGDPVVPAAMDDNLMTLVRHRPGTVVVPSAAGAVQETYELLAAALR